MPLEKKPFVPYRTEEERAKDKRETTGISLNPEDKEMIEWLRVHLNIYSQTKALKFAAHIGYNVLKHDFSEKQLAFLTDGKRERLTDYKRQKSLKTS